MMPEKTPRERRSAKAPVMEYLLRIVFFLILCMTLAFSLSAEVYRYKDAKGISHFTDNILDVPADQRKTAEVYREIRSTTPENKPAEPAKEETNGTDLRQKQYKELLEEQEALDQAYLKLEARKKALDKEKQTISTPGQLEAFREKIKVFNEDVTDFTGRKEAFAEKSRAFNQKKPQTKP